MVTFPASWLLYALYVGGGLLLLLAALYLNNGLKHGGSGHANVLSSGIFIAGILVMAWVTFNLLGQVDWTTTFSIQLPNLSFIKLPF